MLAIFIVRCPLYAISPTLERERIEQEVLEDDTIQNESACLLKRGAYSIVL